MQHEYLMNAASVLYIACYLPELYANYKNRNANAYNVPEKIVMLTATIFALSYAILNQDTPLMLNYGPIFALDTVALVLRVYYMKTDKSPIQDAEIGIGTLTISSP